MAKLNQSDRIALAAELLKLDSIQSRVTSALESIQPEHDYSGTAFRRSPRGSMKRFVVINQEGVSLQTDSDPEIVDHHAQLRNSSVFDMKQASGWFRRKLTSILRIRPSGSSYFEPPEKLGPPVRTPRPDQSGDARELRNEIQKLQLPDDIEHEVLRACSNILTQCGRDAAHDVLFEIGLLQYTAVYDCLDHKIVEQCSDEDGLPAHQAAAAVSKALNAGPDGMLMMPVLGPDRKPTGEMKPSGHYRYKTVKPHEIEQEQEDA